MSTSFINSDTQTWNIHVLQPLIHIKKLRAFFFFFAPLAKLATKDIYYNTNKIKLKKKRKKEKEKEKERSPNIALTKFFYIYKMGI